MWDLIVSVPDHCLSFYFKYINFVKTLSILTSMMVRLSGVKRTVMRCSCVLVCSLMRLIMPMFALNCLL